LNADQEPDERDPAGDLAWRAFRYAAGELTPDEAQAFEAQMAVDPAVCDAAARAVKLGGELAAARSAVDEAPMISRRSVIEPAHARSQSLFAWAAIAAAVCLAFLGGRYAARRDHDAPQSIAETASPAAPSPLTATVAADAWLQLRDLQTASDDAEFQWDDGQSDGVLRLEPGGASVPPWMVDLAAENRKGKS
jgi:hypothetical protein